MKARHRGRARRRASRCLLLRRARGRFAMGLRRRFRRPQRGRCLWLRRRSRSFRWRSRFRLRGSRFRRNLRRRWRDQRIFRRRRSLRNHGRRICRRFARRGRNSLERDLHRRRCRLLPCRVLGQPAHDGENTEPLDQERSCKRNGQRGALVWWVEMIGRRNAHNYCTPTGHPWPRVRPGRCPPCDMHP
ncbi:hypothetical protein FBZ93_12229 [Bradyrhizobium macuxiense]|uniref:Uncharacterized protein n=1 Tax=Bradyrhizobium macuxiense TaxID=1755647 RepID=A0A560KVG6_9BRAD|nr:hypothetical protein FBZ93_12229 [Bradyrhizobium macuxiense]